MVVSSSREERLLGTVEWNATIIPIYVRKRTSSMILLGDQFRDITINLQVSPLILHREKVSQHFSSFLFHTDEPAHARVLPVASDGCGTSHATHLPRPPGTQANSPAWSHPD